MKFEAIEDFLDNERFNEWLKTSDPGLDGFWKQWLEENSDKKELFYKAVSLRLMIAQDPENWKEESIPEKLSALEQRLRTEPDSRFKRRSWYYMAAAAVLIGVLGGVLMQTLGPLSEERNPVAGLPAGKWKTIGNEAGSPALVNLPDGSSAMLSEGSVLSFDPVGFGENERTVNLEGEAFFEIVKDASRPFYVHTPALVTKVLGTSFRVRSFEKESDSRVTVVTGKVEVSAPSETRRDVASVEKVVLEKDEEVILLKADDRLVKTAAGQARPVLGEGIDLASFDLKFVPAGEIFSLLEKVYGVKIVHNSDDLAHCTLTADLRGVPFLKKLDLICAGIDAEYTVDGALVRISGSGCAE